MLDAESSPAVPDPDAPGAAGSRPRRLARRREASDRSRSGDWPVVQRAPVCRSAAPEPTGPREHLAPRRLWLAERDRLDPGPRALPGAHGVQRVDQLPPGLGGAVLPVARPRLRP